jgi:protein-cysteine N-palmitoyltransferase HHAT
LGATVLNFVSSGWTFSTQFDAGGAWDGRLPGLRRGWLLGRKVDLSDAQWRSFRGSLPALGSFFAAFAVASRLLLRPAAPGAPWRAARGRAAALHLGAATIFLLVLHGACAVYPVALALGNFVLTRGTAGGRLGAVAPWVFNISALLAARLMNGFKLYSVVVPLVLGGSEAGSLLGATLDGYRGLTRWEICFNITVLRMLSFSLDLHRRRLVGTGGKGSAENGTSSTENCKGNGISSHGDENGIEMDARMGGGEKANGGDGKNRDGPTAVLEIDPPLVLSASPPPPRPSSFFSSVPPLMASWFDDEASRRARKKRPLPDAHADYSLFSYLSYAFYPPLYLAGPIVTFQDFEWQMRARGQKHHHQQQQQQQHQQQQMQHLQPVIRSPSKMPEPPSSSTVLSISASPSTAHQRLLGPQHHRRPSLARYALLTLTDLACIELLTHLLYFNAVAKSGIGLRLRGAGLTYGAFEVAMTGWWALTFTWIKFALIWRVMRLAALAEGVDPPENMRRCFANNYDVEVSLAPKKHILLLAWFICVCGWVRETPGN